MIRKVSLIGNVSVTGLTFVAALLLSTGLEGARPPGGGGGGGKEPSATFSGQARVVYVNLLGGSAELVLSDTGALPSNGGALEKSLLTVNTDVAGISLDANVLHATTVGQGTESRAESSVASVDLTVSGVTIAADLLVARAAAACSGGTALVSGSSDILNLRIAGQSITVSGNPNQTVSLNVGVLVVAVIINEQTGSASGGTGAMTVNALHVYIDSPLTGRVAEVVLSSAHADISCGKPVCFGGDFVTGGGFITGTPGGARGNFAVAGGIKKRGLWGHLNYIDHGTGMHVKGTSITAYTVINATTRRIDGTAEINGQGGFTFTATVADNGEPGRNDTFLLSLSNGYIAGGTLGGGNIQLHKPANCP